METILARLNLPQREFLVTQAREILAQRNNPRSWIETNLQIRTKDQRIIPFHFNAAQIYYYKCRSFRDIILKPRQLGFTTLICGLYFADCLLRPNTTSVIVAHDSDSSKKIFRIVQLFWEKLSAKLQKYAGRPRYSNKQEFLWPKINSHFFVGTAGSLTFGRGQTINNLHCSELAFWAKPQEALIALTEAVSKDGRIVIESTANGVGSYFHTLWQEAWQQENSYRASFYYWWDDPTYQLPGPRLKDLSPEEQQLKTTYGLSNSQLRWRREKQHDLKDKFLQEYPEDDVTCFLTSGGCCFDTLALRQAAQRIESERTQSPPKVLAFLPSKKSDPFSLSPAGLEVYQSPQKDCRYVIGADVGEGLSNGDASVACVLDWLTGEQVAELYGKISPEKFAHMLVALGYFYNLARLGVESNNHGHSTLNTLRNVLHYPRLYYHQDYDQSGKVKAKLGWPTNRKTKPILIDDLAAAIACGDLLIHSSGLVDECFSFVSKSDGSQEAQEGAHDDRVMAAGIAWQLRKRRARHGIET